MSAHTLYAGMIDATTRRTTTERALDAAIARNAPAALVDSLTRRYWSDSEYLARCRRKLAQARQGAWR